MTTHGTRYLRFAALGDSSTFGLGDPVPGGWRGWSRLLASGLEASGHDVSFCNLAIPGATAGVVLAEQVADAIDHRPDLVSLVVGVNDVLKSSWDPGRLREQLGQSADALTADGATLMTVRFHQHDQVMPLPGPLRLSLRSRIEELNDVWDEVYAIYGGIRVDLGAMPEPLDRTFWAVDRLHPSERGHRCLARAFARGLQGAGIDVVPPGTECSGGLPQSWRTDVAWLVAQGAPWVGRRARDLGPWVARRAWSELRPVVTR